MIGLSLSGTKIRDFVYARQRFSAGGKDNAYYRGKNRQTYEDFCNEILLVPSLQHLNHGNLIFTAVSTAFDD